MRSREHDLDYADDPQTLRERNRSRFLLVLLALSVGVLMLVPVAGGVAARQMFVRARQAEAAAAQQAALVKVAMPKLYDRDDLKAVILAKSEESVVDELGEPVKMVQDGDQNHKEPADDVVTVVERVVWSAQGRRSPILDRRGVDVVRFLERVPEVVAELRVLRIEFDGTAIGGDCIRVIEAVHKQCAEQVVQPGRRGGGVNQPTRRGEIVALAAIPLEADQVRARQEEAEFNRGKRAWTSFQVIPKDHDLGDRECGGKTDDLNIGNLSESRARLCDFRRRQRSVAVNALGQRPIGESGG